MFWDNASIHGTKKSIKQCLESNLTIITNAVSKPDFNVIESVFNVIKLEKRNQHIDT